LEKLECKNVSGETRECLEPYLVWYQYRTINLCDRVYTAEQFNTLLLCYSTSSRVVVVVVESRVELLYQVQVHGSREREIHKKKLQWTILF
jgi:hypothetical protein